MQRYEIRTCGKCQHFPEVKHELDFAKCRALPGLITQADRPRNFAGCYEPRTQEKVDHDV